MIILFFSVLFLLNLMIICSKLQCSFVLKAAATMLFLQSELK